MVNDFDHGMDCRIYVPVKFTRDLRIAMAQLNLGFTEYPATGKWCGPDGKVVSDNITVFSIITKNHEVIQKMFAEMVAVMKAGGESVVLTQFVPCSFRIQ